MKIEPIYLTSKDLENIKKKKIAKGREGTIYKIKPGVLYKIYHEYNDNLLWKVTPVYDSEGVNIASYKNYDISIKERKILKYFDKEGTRLSREAALYKAIERQKDIKHTDLPKNVIYVDHQIKGCVLKEHYPSFKIYAIESLPFQIRLKLLKQLLLKVRELLDHNIYPVDLAQRPTIDYPYTNVLYQIPFQTQIIDLDGESTIYTESFSEEFYRKAVQNYVLLSMEILTHINLEKFLENLEEYVITNPEIEKYAIFYIQKMTHNRLPYEMAEKFLHEKLTLEDMERYINLMMKKSYKR